MLDLAVDSGQIRVGLVTYSGEVEERFNLIRYSRRDDLSSAISSMTYSATAGYVTATADAIAYVRQVSGVDIQGGPKKNGATLHFPKYLENY